MSKTVFTFGRMNPPTIGHQKLVDKVKAEAKKQGAMPHVYLSHTQNAKKDPLDYNTKIRFARKAFGPSVTKSASKTIIQVLQELEKMGHTEATLVVGSDRVGEFKTFLNKYNGKDFTFKKIKVISAGQRDPDAEGTAGMSATKIRGLAQAGELEEFGKGLPSTFKANDTKAIYNKVRKVMGITESVEIEDEDFEFTEQELDAFIEMTDLEGLDERTDIDEDFETLIEQIELYERTPLTVQQRMKIGRRMKRLAPKMQRKKEIQKKKMADKPRLEKRSRKAAIKLLRTKFAGKQGANYASLSPGAKISVDRIIQKKMGMVNTISKRMLPKVRKAEMDRLKAARSSKKVVGTANESFDMQFESYIAVEIILEGEDKETNQKLLYMLRQAFTDATERQLVIRALKGGEKSLQNPKLRPFILKLLNRLLDATQSDPTMFVKMKDRLRRMSQDDSKKEVEEDKRPAKYHSGLSKSTSDKRASHFKKQGDKPDEQASAYKPAPGDATAKTKTSKHTSKFKAMYGEDMDIAFEKFISEEYIEEKSLDGLKKKAEKSGIPYGILKKVYDRGMAAWKTGHRPGTTPQQWAYARVNSFTTKSKGTWGGADKDLASKVREEVELDLANSLQERNYAKERENYHSRPEQMRNNAARKRARYQMEKKGLAKKFDGLDVAHKDNDPQNNNPNNLEMQTQALNRTEPRLREEKIQEEVELDEAKTHFVYQKNVDKTKTIVHRGDEKSSREWISKNSKHYDHEGKNFVIYKGKPGNVSLRDVVEARKSPLQRLKNFDKTRVAVGKKPIFDPKSTEFRNVSKKQKKLDQTSNEDVDAAKAIIAREKEADKVKHDAMMDRARTRETQAKNRSTNESIDDVFTAFLDEGFSAGIDDTMFATEFAENQIQSGFAFHPSVTEEGGAGEFGTSKLKKKYSKDTPYAEETYDGDEFEEAYGMMWFNEDEELDEAEYQGNKVTLGKPSAGDVKKFKVYVKNEKGNVVKVNFGDPNMTIKKHIPARRKSFRARHNCDNPGPRTSARYWSCKNW